MMPLGLLNAGEKAEIVTIRESVTGDCGGNCGCYYCGCGISSLPLPLEEEGALSWVQQREMRWKVAAIAKAPLPDQHGQFAFQIQK